MRRRQPAVLLRCRAKVRPSAFLCRLSSSVGLYAPPAKSCFILRRVTVYHRRSYRHHSHRGSHSRSHKVEVTAADPEAEVGARSRILSRSAGGFTGRIRFLSVHLSSGKRGTAHDSLGWWHAIRYYVRHRPHIHPGGHHATILTVLHTSSAFQCGWPTQHDGCITLVGWYVQPLAYAWRPARVNVSATRCSSPHSLLDLDRWLRPAEEKPDVRLPQESS